MPKKRSWQKMEYSKTVTDGSGKAVTDGKGKEVKSRGKPAPKSTAKTSASKASSGGGSKSSSRSKTKQYSGRGSVGMPTKKKPSDGGVNRAERRNPIKANSKPSSSGPKTRAKVTGAKSTSKRSQTGPSKRRENMGKYNSMSPVGGAVHRLVRGKSGGNPTNIRNSQKAYRKRRSK